MRGAQVDNLSASLAAMNTLQEHRGPDGQGVWMHASQRVGFAHRRLSIIGLETGAQPMRDRAGNWITYNGEIYNYIELREELGVETFETDSDTEVILAAYRRWGQSCVSRLRGMFAFAIWDEAAGQLFCVRDRFGIKPFHFTRVGDTFYFASEAKALLPFVPAIETDYEALKEYLAFQFCLAGKTLFKGISQLLPGHTLTVQAGGLAVSKYWEVYYRLDFEHTARYFEEQLRDAIDDSVRCHVRSDVPIGAYVSGGFDSAVVASLATGIATGCSALRADSITGLSTTKSAYARGLADHCGFPLEVLTITAEHFVANIAEHHLPHGLSGRRAWSIPAVHGCPAGQATPESGAGGSGRRRDFRGLCALSDRVLRAVHQGRH